MVKWIVGACVAGLLGFYLLFGFFIIQPIGAVPEGVTIFYFRAGLNLEFIDSADAFSMRVMNGQVSLFSRALALGTVGKHLDGRVILRLPYSETLYSISTNGKMLDR